MSTYIKGIQLDGQRIPADVLRAACSLHDDDPVLIEPYLVDLGYRFVGQDTLWSCFRDLIQSEIICNMRTSQ